MVLGNDSNGDVCPLVCACSELHHASQSIVAKVHVATLSVFSYHISLLVDFLLSIGSLYYFFFISCELPSCSCVFVVLPC